MENRNSLTPFAFTRYIFLLVAAAALLGCGSVAQSADQYGALLKEHERGGEITLRTSVDAARKRLWVLGLHSVNVYDIGTQQRIRQIALPPLSVAGIPCPPALVLDRAGSAFVSSNAEPRLWKIDTADFSMKEHTIRLLGKEGWDSGFGALAFAADGTLFGLSSFGGSLWRIDIAKSSAREVSQSERRLNTCTFDAPRQTIPDT